MKLNEFLVNAKRATYANNKAKKILKNGAKELTYQEKDLKYLDRYYGFNPFVGQEIVFKNKNIIWSMNYYGRIISNKIPATKVYQFLKTALRMVTEDKPFRGPNNFKDGYFEYSNIIKGDTDNFSGTERIFYKKQQIYTLVYHGGIVKN